MESNEAGGPVPFPLFKGCTRLPLLFGIPVQAFLLMICGVALIAMWVSLWCWLLSIPAYIVMRGITIADDKAFRIIGLRIETKVRNVNKKVWGASSYTPIGYSKRRFEE